MTGEAVQVVVGWETKHQCERGYSCSKYYLNGGKLCLQEAIGSLDAANQILESQKEEARRGPSRGKEDPEGLVSAPTPSLGTQIDPFIQDHQNKGCEACLLLSLGIPSVCGDSRMIPGAFQRCSLEF